MDQVNIPDRKTSTEMGKHSAWNLGNNGRFTLALLRDRIGEMME
jgi:hypothetical protein